MSCAGEVVKGKSSGRMSEFGWVWEGQAFKPPGVYPSIFGVGEGAKYFGLSRVVFIFFPNTELAMEKLGGMDEIVCDISKWKYIKEGDAVTYAVDGSPEKVRSEAELVSSLSLKYPNIKGGFHDDMHGLVKREKMSPQDYARIYEAFKSQNPDMRLWAVAYSHELEEDWQRFMDYIDVVDLWVWHAKDLVKLDKYFDRCREVFPNKPINIGCYLRDYPEQRPIPMELLKGQLDWVRGHIEDGSVSAYSILGAFLIDGQEEQARWVRDFIRAN